MNGLATPGVLQPFGLGLAAPAALASAYGGALPSLGAFALAQTGALGAATPAGLRGLSNVLLVSNLNEEVSSFLLLLFSTFLSFFSWCCSSQQSTHSTYNICGKHWRAFVHCPSFFLSFSLVLPLPVYFYYSSTLFYYLV